MVPAANLEGRTHSDTGNWAVNEAKPRSVAAMKTQAKAERGSRKRGLPETRLFTSVPAATLAGRDSFGREPGRSIKH